MVVGRARADGTDGEATGGGGGKEEKRRAACRDAFTVHVTTLTSGSCQIWQDGGLSLRGEPFTDSRVHANRTSLASYAEAYMEPAPEGSLVLAQSHTDMAQTVE